MPSLSQITQRAEMSAKKLIWALAFTTFAYALLSMLMSRTAFAWATKADVRATYAASASYSVLKRGQVNYCLRYVDKPFSADSIAPQVEASLGLWLQALSKSESIPLATVHQVACTDADLTVMIDISRTQKGFDFLGYTAPIPNLNGRSFMYMHLATDSSCPTGSANKVGLIDFSSIFHGDMKAMDSQIEQLIKGPPMTGPAFAMNHDLDFRFGSCDTLTTFIHEMGHTFGLCDTYDYRPAGECEPNWQSKTQPSSVMSGNKAYFLSADDLEGLHHTYQIVKALSDGGDPDAALAPPPVVRRSVKRASKPQQSK